MHKFIVPAPKISTKIVTLFEKLLLLEPIIVKSYVQSLGLSVIFRDIIDKFEYDLNLILTYAINRNSHLFIVSMLSSFPTITFVAIINKQT